MADTMQLLTVASRDVPLRDQHSRSSHVTRQERVMRPVASNAFARLATGLTLALAVIAGTVAATRSAAADEMWKASRETSAAAAASSPVTPGPERILARPTDPDPATRYVEKLYKQLMRSPRP